MGSGFPATARAALVVTGALSLGACAAAERALGPGQVDETSAVAARVKAASAADLPTPSFRDVPPPPKDFRTAAAIQAEVARALAEQQKVQAYADANPPPTTDIEAWAAQARARIPESERAAPPPDASGTEEFAARLRATVTPPPPPNR